VPELEPELEPALVASVVPGTVVSAVALVLVSTLELVVTVVVAIVDVVVSDPDEPLAVEDPSVEEEPLLASSVREPCAASSPQPTGAASARVKVMRVRRGVERADMGAEHSSSSRGPPAARACVDPHQRKTPRSALADHGVV
jgi:hypothetical protein